MEQFSSRLALDDFLLHLKRRHPPAVLKPLLVPQAFVVPQRHAATLERLGKLRLQLHPQKLDDGHSRQYVHHQAFIGFGLIQRADMQLRQQRLEIEGLGPGRLRFGSRAPHETIHRRLLRRFGGQQSVHIAMPHDQPRHMHPRLFHKSAAQVNVVPQIIHTRLQPFER